MLCGASEIGLVDEIDGLLELPDDAPIGVDVRDYLGLDAMIFDIAITPNRGDCFSALGLAREISVINRLPLNCPEIKAITPSTDKKSMLMCLMMKPARVILRSTSVISTVLPRVQNGWWII